MERIDFLIQIFNSVIEFPDGILETMRNIFDLLIFFHDLMFLLALELLLLTAM
jgi:hypothetical protein